MTKTFARTVVRLDQRTYPSKEVAAWGHSGGGTLARALVRDYSDSGIALEVPKDQGIDLGTSIRVVRSEHELVKHARVVRVSEEPGDAGTVRTLGCRWVRAVDRRARAGRSGFPISRAKRPASDTQNGGRA